MNIKGSNFNADHVLERQLGGTDTLDNLWPLDAGINGSGGSTLHHMQVELTPGVWSKVVDMKNTSRKYFLKVVSTL
ncbi:HNH endonuclease [Deinococcus hohokamensis]|uniref:HNH endonuclease n=1 Tax=Deinococcus hohokamensis TaxID=309883 RepID=A0ABV9IDA5_9DEIO